MRLTFLGPKHALTLKAQKQIQRHTLRVKILRIGVPLLISAAVGGIIAQYAWHNAFVPKVIQAEKAEDFNFENQLINARLMSKDAQGRPLMIKAKKATQSGDDSFLETPESQLQFTDGQMVTITSGQGELEGEKKILSYQDHVTMTTSNGMVIVTDRATVDLDSKTARGVHPISGQGPQGKVDAQGFELHDKTLALRGKSKLTLY